ncbi:thiamine-monophosphate kinase [Sphingobium jiangsuense]|uniref:Thiamine-monophosphate kinase n=2 Tax=Sphingobium jiangsuense TaxID=870476 RepID=A0A7W6BEN5_9SPHN|nr:thiamine-phosphate kinase [Sphingobium jiangsuense]MBB3924709.1 thiamine-monophosphate kinase [Sphingobium jiangsuense]
MSEEGAFIALMRTLATAPGARGLMDDAAVLDRPAGGLVLTHDMMVEGVHFLPGDPPESVAWKLCAVNMSDLAAKGATPLGALIGYGMAGDPGWNEGFARGLGEALGHFGAALLGGDTVRMPDGGPRTLGLTAIGAAPACGAPARSGARAGDLLFVTGTLGDAGAGLALLLGQADAPEEARARLIEAYRRPRPPVALGPALAPHVSAMADVSDGLLIDANRIAQASGLAIAIDLARTPLSPALVAARGEDAQGRLAAATAGDDYQLLFTARPQEEAAIRALAAARGIAVTAVGRCEAGPAGLTLTHAGAPVPLPGRLGYEHGAS